jgi:YHS domain-containing protein
VDLPLGLIAASLLAALPGATQAGEVNTGYFGNVAIEGYDTVAYFTDGKAIKGSEKYAYDWLGASWQFASDEHRKLFAASPIAYAPQFGGLCSEGVAYNEITVNLEPEVFQIIDGKLYLVAGAQFGEGYGEERRPQADENWAKVRDLLIQ